MEPTTERKRSSQRGLIEMDHGDQDERGDPYDPPHMQPPARATARRTLVTSSWKSPEFAAPDATTITSAPGRTSGRRIRTASRTRRFARFRSTAPRRPRAAVMPTLGGRASGSMRTCATMAPSLALRPSAYVRRISSADVSFPARPIEVRRSPGAYTVSRERCLRRRLARIARPARVRMRARNPWVRLRRRRCGW